LSPGKRLNNHYVGEGPSVPEFEGGTRWRVGPEFGVERIDKGRAALADLRARSPLEADDDIVNEQGTVGCPLTIEPRRTSHPGRHEASFPLVDLYAAHKMRLAHLSRRNAGRAFVNHISGRRYVVERLIGWKPHFS
jgi:hypothetical protein